jgi:hypothetical protein
VPYLARFLLIVKLECSVERYATGNLQKPHSDDRWETCMDMKQSEKNTGIRLLVEKGREAFRIAENINYYSEQDYKTAEKKFIKLCVIQHRC